MKIATNDYQFGFGIPAGSYPFKIIEAEEGKSREKKYDMIKLVLSVDVPGREEPINCYDNLVNMPKALFKIEQFVKATGQPEKFTVKGKVAECSLTADDCLGKGGMARLVADRETGFLKVRAYLKPKGIGKSLALAPVPKSAPASQSKPQRASGKKKRRRKKKVR